LIVTYYFYNFYY